MDQGHRFSDPVGKIGVIPARPDASAVRRRLALSALVNVLTDSNPMEEGTHYKPLLGLVYRESSPHAGGRVIHSPRRYPGIDSSFNGRVTTSMAVRSPRNRFDLARPAPNGLYDIIRKRRVIDDRACSPRMADGLLFGAYGQNRSDTRSRWMPVLMIRAQTAWQRPAHIHFLVGALRLSRVVTALYLRDESAPCDDVVRPLRMTLAVGINADDTGLPHQGLPPSASMRLQRETRPTNRGRVGADPARY